MDGLGGSGAACGGVAYIVDFSIGTPCLSLLDRCVRGTGVKLLLCVVLVNSRP